jgi:drug/metabolite transporter, DME family
MSEAHLFPAMFAVGAAFLFSVSIHIQNLGLGHVDPQSGTIVNIGTTALIYWALSPFFIEMAFWLTSATAWFAMVGLFRPVLSSNLAIASVKIMGPTLTSGIAATNPLFAVGFAVLWLGEMPTWTIAIGTLAVVAGVAVTAVRPGGIARGWPVWALTLPLGAAFFRALGHPLIMTGFKELPSPYFAGLVAYTVSFIVALTAFRVQGRRFSRFSWGYGWFVLSGMLTGVSVFLLNSALKFGQLLVVAPVVACSPVFTILLSVLIFKRESITLRTVGTIVLVVSGIVLVVLP